MFLLSFLRCHFFSYRQDAWDLTAADDGQITLDEWYSFIEYLGDKDQAPSLSLSLSLSILS